MTPRERLRVCLERRAAEKAETPRRMSMKVGLMYLTERFKRPRPSVLKVGVLRVHPCLRRHLPNRFIWSMAKARSDREFAASVRRMRREHREGRES